MSKEETTFDHKHSADNQEAKAKAKGRMKVPLGQIATSYVYGVNYPSGWLFFKDGPARPSRATTSCAI